MSRFARFLPLLLALLLPGGGHRAAANPLRHLVLVVADDLGLTAGCYGDRTARTPHLDQLASEGMVFHRAFATTASCSASRSVLLSGLHNHLTGQYGHSHDYHHFTTFPWVQTLPALLSRAGYRTARVGKWHVAPDSVYPFDAVLPGGCRQPKEMAARAAEWLRQNLDRPTFLLFSTCDPHRSGKVGSALPGAPDLFGNETDPAGDSKAVIDPAAVTVPSWLPDSAASRAELAQYYQSVARMDAGLGALVQALKEIGIYEQALIVFTSDNGMAFAGAKTTVYEPGIRVPLILRGPPVRAPGHLRDALVSLVDVTPTLLDYAGLMEGSPSVLPARWSARGWKGAPGPYRFHGRSFLPLLQGGPQEEWTRVFASHTFHEVTMYYPMRVVREGRYKLIWNLAHPLPFPFASDLWASSTWQEAHRQGPQARYGRRTVQEYVQRPEFELYDLQSDPDEARNLAASPDQAGRLKEMKQALHAFQKETGDPWILKWQYE